MLCMALAGCGVSDKGSAGKETATTGKEAAAAGVELPLPAIPADLKTPEERADYLALHFWDAMDWRDHRLALDTVFVEQNFANYLSGLPYATDAGLTRAVSALMDTVSSAGTEQRDFLYGVAEKYLYQQDSPLRDERLFLAFVDWAIERSYDSERAEVRREDIMRNRPGSEAADFSYELRDGVRGRLSGLRGRRVLLMFYEPDCDQCLDAEKRLAESAAFNRLVATGELQMLAVYVGHDRRLWSEHAAKLPASWIVGIDAAMKIDDEDLYHIGATPSFYLIDAEGTVMVKDAAFPAVANALRL